MLEAMPARLKQLHHWISHSLGITEYTLAPASMDASFRRYFRLGYNGETRIVMDAPPEREKCDAYIDINTRLLAAGVHAPAILGKDLDQGFLLLSDLGTVLYLDALTEDNTEELYGDALTALADIQSLADKNGLPPYDEPLLLQEMRLFPDWLLDRHVQISLTERQQAGLQRIFDVLIANALEQPRVFVHRDYHSRNLMVCPGKNPGIVDFQDAVDGPVTYDLVSLLKDCYIKWPRQRINEWALGFRRQAHGPAAFDDRTFLRWFDLMGVQRHLKASGIFARLYHRDHKDGFLKDIPRTLSFIVDLGQEYAEMDPLVELIEGQVLPALEEAHRPCAP
ncbi:MAG: aminoglycoside phosphotransferase family protein [Gammaproteobacteria bacterium]